MAQKKSTKKKSTAKKPDVAPSEKKRAKSPYGDMSVDQLLQLLESSQDAIVKRKIRAQLRRQGHMGGMNKTTATASDTPKKTAQKKTTKKKTAKKKKS